MFLSDELPEAFEATDTSWAGTYRDHPLDAHQRTDGAWVLEVDSHHRIIRDSLIQTLQMAKCEIDWNEYQKGWRGVAQRVHQEVRALIEDALVVEGAVAEPPSPGPAWFGRMRKIAGAYINEHGDGSVRGFWHSLNAEEQTRLARHIFDCILAKTRPIPDERWERVKYVSKLDPKVVGTWKEMARAWSRPADEPKPKPKAKPKLKLRRPPQDPEPIPRRFGVCKRCKVCLAYDVNQGCCTVCGRGLTANPSAKEGIACGLCFPWAWRDVFDNGGTLVHGMVTTPQKRPRHSYAHAWVERDGKVYDWQTMKAGHGGRHRGKGYPRDLFYDLYEPEEVRRFDQEEAMVNLPRYGHYGPWDDAPTENPQGRYVESPTFRYQLFIPRHEKDWKGLPKTVRLDPVSERRGPTNKPHGAFWTSTLGEHDGEDTSDWESWMRGNMPSWHVPKGIVLEVGSHANVKHLRTKQEAEDFLNEYGTPGLLSLVAGEQPRREKDLFGDGEWWGLMQVVPEWERLFEDFDGLHLEGGALAHPAFYGWDAESTAWFTTDPLREVRQIDLAPAEDDDDDEEEENPRPRRKRKRLKNGRLTRDENARLFRRLMRQ